MAWIYNMARLLPPGHPYLNPSSIGKFGIRHVVAAAANNLVISRRNIDQIIIFVALLIGVVVLFLQLGLMLYGLVVHPAAAGAVAPLSLFATPNPVGVTVGGTPDIAFNLLDRVFGVPELFCTIGNVCTSVMPGNVPWPFHVALHELLRFYSLGLLLIGVLILLYFIVVIVAETATTGHPFGHRFKHIWAPIRLVVALGLLVPINYGLNSAQFITLYAAKFGSGFATNAWHTFNDTIMGGGARGNPTGERTSLVARPLTPDVSSVVQFMSIVHGCTYLYWKMDNAVRTTAPPPSPPVDYALVKPYFVKHDQSWLKDHRTYEIASSYDEGLKFYDNSDIIIRFGERNPDKFKSDPGNVDNKCGEIRIKVGALQKAAAGGGIGGAETMQRFYFDMVMSMWNASGPGRELATLSYYLAEIGVNNEGALAPADTWQCQIAGGSSNLPPPPDCATQPPDSKARQEVINAYQAQLNAAVHNAWIDYNNNGIEIEMTPQILNRGWAGAGIWYNVIQQINGAFSNAVINVPFPQSLPDVMKKVMEERRKEDSGVNGTRAFCPNISKGNEAGDPGGSNTMPIAKKLCEFYKYWNDNGVNQNNAGKSISGNVFRDFISNFFGPKGLFSVTGYNAHVHPLAQLTILGKTLVDAAVFSMAASIISGGGGAIINILDNSGFTGTALDLLSTLFSRVAGLALTAGVVLYYVLPFLPFLYFFFAVGTWVMSIFEAMVGVPLWALAHLRLDGEGLPGEAASNGYFLILEIFLRPIMTVFGLIASIVIFSAQIRVLNAIWPLVIGNLTGYIDGTDSTGQSFTGTLNSSKIPRDQIDQFFFSIIYVIFAYMMATASFKVIDKIPDHMLRYLGTGGSSFSDINPDATEGLTRYVALGGVTMGKDLTGAVAQSAKALGGATAQALAGKGAGPQ